MSLSTNLSDAFTRVATEAKSLRTLINGNAADLASLNTTAKNNLVAAINEVYASLGSAGATVLDELGDVTITLPGTGHVLRYDGTGWVNVLGSDYYQPLSAELTSLAGVTTTAYGRDLLALADQAALMGLLALASETTPGIVELATVTEATDGIDTVRAVTPAGLKAATDAAIATLVDTAPGTLDTLNELAAALADDPNFAATMTTALGFRVRVDAVQAFTDPQKAQGRANIDAASTVDVGDTTTNYVTVFEAGLT